MDNQLPREWNGQSTSYHMFDGFNQAGAGGKIAYILLFPLSSLIMEGASYGRSQKAAEAAQDALYQQPIQNNNRPSFSQARDMNPQAQEGTQFRDAYQNQQNSPYQGQQR